MNLDKYTSQKLLHSPLVLVAAQVNYEEVGFDVTHPQAREIQKLMGGDWVRLLAQENSTFVVENNGSSMNQKRRKEYRLNTSDGNSTIIISADHVTLEINEYEGWTSFSNIFEKLCEATAKVFDPANQLRIGVRFVDDIKLPTYKANWKGLIPDSILGLASDEKFMEGVAASDQRAVLLYDDGSKCLLRHGLFKNVATTTNFNFLLDFDLYNDNQVPFNLETIMISIAALHENMGRTFRSCISEELYNWLKGE